MHTIEQAENLWCPMRRDWYEEVASGDAHILVHNESKHSTCRASGCAMWRWTSQALVAEQTKKYDERLCFTATFATATDNPPLSSELKAPKGEGWIADSVPFPDEDGGGYWLQNWKRPYDPERTGYCGLAGKGDWS